eukprot:gene18151-biopygen21925
MPAPCPHHARATHSAPCPRHARASVLFPLGSQDTGAGVARAWGGRGASLACDHHDGRSRAAAAPAPKCPGRPLAWPPPLHPLPALLLALDGGGAAGRGRPHARCRVTVACAAGGRCAAASQFGDLDGPVRASMDSVDLAGLTRLWTGVDTSGQGRVRFRLASGGREEWMALFWKGRPRKLPADRSLTRTDLDKCTHFQVGLDGWPWELPADRSITRTNLDKCAHFQVGLDSG